MVRIWSAVWGLWGVALLSVSGRCAADETNRVPMTPMRPTDHPSHLLLRSENGRDTAIRLIQLDGGRDAKYIVASRIPSCGLLVREWLWPVQPLLPTDIVYDCTEEVLHGKAKPILCDLASKSVRIFAITPTQVERLEVCSAPFVRAGHELTAQVEFQDAGGKRLTGRLPFYAALDGPDGETLRELYSMTEADGTSTLSWRLPSDVLPGKGRLLVRSQLNGLTSRTSVRFVTAVLVDETKDPIADCDEPTPKEKIPRFADEKDLADWRIVGINDFEKHGKVFASAGELILEQGRPATGVAWKGELPRMNYEVSLEAKRVAGDDFFCGLTFPVEKSYCTLIVGGWGGSVTGLSNIDNFPAVENETTGYTEFKLNRWYRVRLRVTPDKIEAWIDDDQIVNVETKDKKFSIWWEQEPVRPLGIATWNTAAAIRNLRVKRR